MTLEQWLQRATRPAVPFVEHGRDYAGWDCYGLLVCAYRDVMSVTVQDYNGYTAVAQYRHLAKLFGDRATSQWKEIDQPQPMASACIYRRGLPIHCGLVIPDGRIVHCEQGVGTIIEPARSLRIEGYYVPAGCGTTSIQG